MTIKSPLFLSASIVLGALAGMPSSAAADSEPTAQLTKPTSAPGVDVEIDPIAYALSGYSLHAGFTWDRFRLDLGAFALEVPEAMLDVKGVNVYGSGFGAKLDYHPLTQLPGLFVGAMLSRTRETVTARTTRESRSAAHTTIGARIGYRVDIANGFYVLPWIGVDVSLSAREQEVAGIDYRPGQTMLFPTVHIGKRF